MKTIFLKISAVVAVLLSFNNSKAQSLSNEDIENIQNLVKKHILIQANGDLQLNQSLKEAGLIKHLENVKATNCGGGSCW